MILCLEVWVYRNTENGETKILYPDLWQTKNTSKYQIERNIKQLLFAIEC